MVGSGFIDIYPTFCWDSLRITNGMVRKFKVLAAEQRDVVAFVKKVSSNKGQEL